MPLHPGHLLTWVCRDQMAYLDLVNDRYALTPSRHPPQDKGQDVAPPAAAEPELLATAHPLPLSMLPSIATMLDDELADAEERGTRRARCAWECAFE